jgi:hypothetical protein
MKRGNKQVRRSVRLLVWTLSLPGILGISGSFPLTAAMLPADWQHEQSFDVPNAGLVKLSLPVETLDATRAGFEDLRLYDDAGNEVPYLIERPAPATRTSRSAKTFQVLLYPATTVMMLETGLTQPVDAVTLNTPANNFIKSVKVEGSSDGAHWQTLAAGEPIFRQLNSAEQLRVSFPPGKWPWLRLTVDDQRSQPLPFVGAQIEVSPGESAPNEPVPVAITERHENPGETRLTLNLGAANLNLDEIQIETTDPLFTRPVTLAVPQIAEDSVREQTVAEGMIYRVAIEGEPISSNLTVALGSPIRSRELLLLIRNQDSPPLTVNSVRAGRRPVYLVFLARQPGAYHLLTGNRRCPAPNYDLAALGANLKSAPVLPIKVPPPTDNPNYKPPEVLTGVEDQGAALDVSAWKFRKPIRLEQPGAQQLELDLDTLAGAQPGFEDLRLVLNGKQLPYIVERTSIHRSLTPAVTMTNDVRNPELSRWILRLPQPNLPVTRLALKSPTTLFQRELSLYELVTDDRGEPYRRSLGAASRVQTPEQSGHEFFLTLEGSPHSDTLFLETANGDNPPINLDHFELFYPATRILFKAKPGGDLFLYYGNQNVPPPRYDLSLVAGQLVLADKSEAFPGAQEQLSSYSARQSQLTGKGGILFWAMLAVVVVVLLVFISKLLPKPPEGKAE